MKVPKALKSVRYSLAAVNCLFLAQHHTNSPQNELDDRFAPTATPEHLQEMLTSQWTIAKSTSPADAPVSERNDRQVHFVVNLCGAVPTNLSLLADYSKVTGLILLTAGIIVLSTYSNYDLLVTSRFYTLPNFAIGTAAVIFITAIVGFYGAISEQFYFIAGYVALLVAVLIFEISVTVLGFELQNKTFNEIRRPMSESLQLYGRMDVNIAWDNLQMGFQCCGIAGVTDWTSTRIGLPVSCCPIYPGTISPFDCTLDIVHKDGCQSVLSQWLEYNAYALGVTAAFVTCLQVLITAAAAWLAYRSKFEEVELER